MAKKYITQDRLKKNTLADIFVFILEKKQTTRREIEYETGFSWGTVSANVAFLIEKGYVTEEKSQPQNAAGRTTYRLVPSSAHAVCIGLDINLSGLSCEIVGLDSQVLEKFEAGLSAKNQAEVLRQSEALLEEAVAWCTAKERKIFSLGIAIQGAVNGKLGISMRFPRIPDWQAYNIKEHFAKKFGVPVYLGHDPKCMLLGEAYRTRYDSCVLVRIDEGIGMAVSLDGRIVDDTERLELGHTLAVPGGRRCRCGRDGCLEAYASLSAIAAANAVDTKTLLQSPAKFDAALREGGSYLASALYNAYVLFKPQRLFLTGKATYLERYTESAVSLLKDEPIEITVAPELSAAYGAAVESAKSAIRSFVI